MTTANKRLIVFLTCLALATSAHAQSPREQLQQLTIQLQQAQNDNALRERIIKLAAEIKPAPAVPEEARRSFVEGVNIVKLAKDAGSQKLAVGSFTEALKIAPWWGDAYYNLAVAQELTGQLNEAERNLKWFLLSNPGESEAREAQDLIYGLSAKRKLAAAEAGAKQEQADREMATQAQRFVGDWFWDYTISSGNYQGKVIRKTVVIRYDASGAWSIKTCAILPYPGGKCAPYFDRLYDIEFVGLELRFKDDVYVSLQDSSVKTQLTEKAIATLSPDGYTLRLAYARMPFNAWQETWWAEMGNIPPSQRIEEFKKQ